jgi:hypothetical protein
MQNWIERAPRFEDTEGGMNKFAPLGSEEIMDVLPAAARPLGESIAIIKKSEISSQDMAAGVNFRHSQSAGIQQDPGKRE